MHFLKTFYIFFDMLIKADLSDSNLLKGVSKKLSYLSLKFL